MSHPQKLQILLPAGYQIHDVAVSYIELRWQALGFRKKAKVPTDRFSFHLLCPIYGGALKYRAVILWTKFARFHLN